MQTFNEATLARRRRRIQADCAAPPQRAAHQAVVPREDVLVATWRAWALQYVIQHFPESIVCTARQYDRASAAATAWDKTARMDETIQHVA